MSEASCLTLKVIQPLLLVAHWTELVTCPILTQTGAGTRGYARGICSA